MKFADIKKPLNKETKIVNIDGNDITIKQNLTTNEIYDLVMITLQEAREDYMYNPLKLDVFFHVNLVMMMTDIEFEAEDRINKFDTYDELLASGVMEEVIANIPKETYTYIKKITEMTADKLEEFENRATAFLTKVIRDLPANAEAAAKIVDEFDPEKFQKVIDFATAANGGRPIGSN